MPSSPRSAPNHQSEHIEDRRRMTAENHAQLASFIWAICNLLRGPYKRNEYRKVILPLTVLRRFDCLLAATKPQVLAEHPKIKTKPETVVRSLVGKISGRPFYNLSKLDVPKLHLCAGPQALAAMPSCSFRVAPMGRCLRCIPSPD